MISGYDGTRATILYNSLTDFELKITDTNKKYDQFNALAPFKVSLLTGNVTFGHEVFFNKNTIYANTYGIKIKDSGGNQVDVLKVTTSNNIHIGMDHYKSVYLGHGGGYTGGCPVVIRANNENLRVSFIEIDNIKYLIGLYDNG
jgi:parallel beta-helix repeat protein